MSSELCSSALLLWRTTTFTLPLIFAGFVTAFYRAAPHHLEKEEGEAPSRETFIEAQRQTLLEREKTLRETIHTNELSRRAIMERLKQVSQPRQKKPKNTSHHRKKKDDNNDEDGNYTINIDS
jgi:hypothetical protein